MFATVSDWRNETHYFALTMPILKSTGKIKEIPARPDSESLPSFRRGVEASGVGFFFNDDILRSINSKLGLLVDSFVSGSRGRGRGSPDQPFGKSIIGRTPRKGQLSTSNVYSNERKIEDKKNPKRKPVSKKVAANSDAAPDHPLDRSNEDEDYVGNHSTQALLTSHQIEMMEPEYEDLEDIL
eukprot:TRINITY_DN3525_c0_g2_i1.p1 TRINITY_DN3525_c0_g2~~TRINITY_DN3525_c0_g2_i1.p1  ORF type:complete len:183 (-),score=21.42 TRINITY_DN3525_c0_g2_i1:28-576(-)